MIVIICGPRDFKDYGELKKAIKASGFDITEIVHGAATGADSLAGDYANEFGIKCVEFPADWNNIKVPDAQIAENAWGKKYNKNAGFARNIKMAIYAVEKSQTHKVGVGCIAIKMKTAGTEHMVSKAKEYNIPVFEYVPYLDIAKPEGEYLYVFGQDTAAKTRG